MARWFRETVRAWWLLFAANPRLVLPRRLTPYAAWLHWNQPASNRTRVLREDLAALSSRPLLSVLLPVFNTPPAFFHAAVDSVLQQEYGDWELVIVDDGSTSPETLAALAATRGRDSRIHLLRHDVTANISIATNAAAAAARGRYFVLLDHDDLLEPDALAQIALYVAAHPDCEWLYSDEDIIDVRGNRSSPRFKPEWSPELLLAYCYPGHLLTFRADLWERMGGLRPGFEGSQDHDLLLRASEATTRVGHIPQILYHWRAAPGSTATRGDAKPLAFSAGMRAVSEAFTRRGVPCRVEQPAWAQTRRVGVFAPVFPDEGPDVAIIIPTRNRRHLIEECLASLEKTTYANWHVYVVDNESDDAATCEYLAALAADGQAAAHRVTVWRIPNRATGFSYAHLMNTAAARVNEEFLLLLNDDVTVIDPRWLSQMVGYLRLEGVGAVGARLHFPDGRVQHAGVLHGLDHGGVGHAFKLLDGQAPGYLLQAWVSRNCSAVTAACMLTKREGFLESAGLDDAHFAVAFNDVDYCARLRDRGLRIVYAPVALSHREGATRGRGRDAPVEVACLRSRYGGHRDPFYNPHLSLDDESFAIRPGVVDWSGPGRSHRLPIRTVFVTHNLNCEGATLSELDLVLGLWKRGVVDPIIVSPVDGVLRREYEAAGLPVVVFDSPAQGSLNRQLTAVIAGHGAELLHANTVDSGWAVVVAGERRIPSVWNIHESEHWATALRGRPVSAAIATLRDCMVPYRAVVRRLRAFSVPYRVVFVSRASRTAWRHVERCGNFCVIPNGFDHQRFGNQLSSTTRQRARQQLGIPAGSILVLAMGRVCRRKRQQDLVRAFSRIPAEIAARIHLRIVGDRACDYTAEYSGQLHALVRGLPSDRRGHVTVEPETADTARFWQAADLFCCASEVESYPRSLQEAMAAGLPIITTPVFGIPEMIRPGVNAEFYPVGDIDRLAAALVRLASDDELRKRYADQSPLVLAGSISHVEMLDEYGTLFRQARLTANDGLDRGSLRGRIALRPISDATGRHR
jgi:glycosyltransferase involved in cell wall biosynthesis